MPAIAEPEAGDADRVDLRDLLTFTVDPPTAKDFDDALTVEFDGAHARVLVHIADVAAHVTPGLASSIWTPRIARPRCTCRVGSTRCCPRSSPTALCSLSPGDDRRALTVTLDPGGGRRCFAAA